MAGRFGSSWRWRCCFTPKRRKRGGTALALEVLCSNLILKPLVARLCFCDINPAVQLLVPRPGDFSFPFGHTGASFAGAAVLFLHKSRLCVPALILAVLIGFSRLYLYVHYPTDVLAGAGGNAGLGRLRPGSSGQGCIQGGGGKRGGATSIAERCLD